MAKGNKPNPPVMNRKPADGKHVPSAVQDATVQDHSAAIAKHVERMPPQATQTVGANPDAPDQRQASGQVVSGIPYTSGSPTGYSAYMGVY